MTGQRLVLRSKATGKIAARKDQGKKALVLKAQLLKYQGLGGGITSLLLPNSPKEKANIAKIDKIYEVACVETRPGKKSGASDKKALIDVLKDDDLIVKLVVHFGEFVGNNAIAHATSAKAFIRWFKCELSKKNSNVYLLAIEQAPVLLEVKRSDRWWADAFAQRKKTQS